MANIKSLDEATVEKKLTGAKNTQESIQSLSLWALHHKAQHDNIVRIWLNILKKSKIQRRLTLFYLCNEIVQTCKRKHAIMYKDAFKEVLRDAVLLVRDNSVRNNIERIFSIWEERNIYDSEFIEDLIAILNNTKIRPSAAKLLAEFKPSKLRENIGSISKLEKETEAKRRRLSSLNFDVTSQNYMKHLKDRSHGKQYTQQIEDSHRHLEEYVNNLDKEIKERQTQLELLEQSELFYDAQYGEAKIVTNAYRNFGTRVTNLRKKLDDVRKTLPDPLSPIPSPSMDAPSPVESVAEVTEDNTEMVDMEMSDAEDDGEKDAKAYSPSNVAASPPPLQQSAYSTKSSLDHLTPFVDSENETLIKPLIGKSISLPSAPENLNSPSDSPGASDAPTVIDYNSSFLSKISAGGLTSFSMQFNSVSQSVGPSSSGIGSASLTNEDSPTVDADDDGGGTPVQDEKPDTTSVSTLDPVALLNKLLSCSKKPALGGTDFLKSLSVLTQSMNVPFTPLKKDEKSETNILEEGNAMTSQPNKMNEDPSPQIQPFYHSEDYLSTQPHSSRSSGGSSSVVNLELVPNSESSAMATVPNSGYHSVSQSGAVMESDSRNLLLPPPLPPKFNFPVSGYPSVGKFEPAVSSTYEQQLAYSAEPQLTAASGTGKMEDTGNFQNMRNEGILNMRPDLVEMLKNVLNTTKTPSTFGQGVPDVVGLRPPLPKPSMQFPDMPVSVQAVTPAMHDFHSSDDNGEFVERLKKKTGFSSPVGDPLISPTHFAHMLNTGQQRMHSFPTENEFQGPNHDAPNFHGQVEPKFTQSSDPPMRFDNYDSQGLPVRQFSMGPPIPPGGDEIHPIAPMVPGRNISEIVPRNFGADYLNNERDSANGPREFDRHVIANRFPEPPFFNTRPRFPPEFSQGNPPNPRPFISGPPSHFPPMRPPPRFSPRGFYPPY